MIKNLREINKKIEKIDNEINSHKNMIDSLYMDKVSGLVDEDMYKRIYDKTKAEIKKLEIELEELMRKKDNNKSVQNTSSFNRCKKSVLDYMSLKNPTKNQIMRLIDRIEIDKDKKIYVHLKFPELIIND